MRWFRRMWLLFQSKIYTQNSPILHMWPIVFVELLWCLWSASYSIELTRNCDNNELDWIGDVFFHPRRHIFVVSLFCCCSVSCCRIKSMVIFFFFLSFRLIQLWEVVFFHRHFFPIALYRLLLYLVFFHIYSLQFISCLKWCRDLFFPCPMYARL